VTKPARDDHDHDHDDDEVNQRLRTFWDEDAGTYDLYPSHAVSDPAEAAAWRAALRRNLPEAGASVLDAGAGTGAMSLLAAELGYRVTALDLSPGMLARARQKAEEARLDIDTVVGPATEPPPGPFDAVIERHLMWTMPDPVTALAAWRRAAPEGRVVLFEGLWSRKPNAALRARQLAVRVSRSLLRQSHSHHAEFDPDLLASLPLARAMSPRALVDALAEAGWRRCRLERLRDVEWARRMAEPPVLGWLESVPQFALVAEA
jgi:SAM-dependent methyltransferase